MKRYLLAATLCVPLAGAVRAAEEKSPAGPAQQDPLVLDAAAQEQLRVSTAVAAMQALVEEIKAPGEVKANAYATVLVSPRVAAQVVRRQVHLGDDVTVGQALVTLSSVDVAEAQGALIVAEREWGRVRALGTEAVSAKRYTEAQVARDQAHAKLRAFGVADGEIGVLLRVGSKRATGEFSLLATQAGRVTTDDFVVGERVEPGKVLFTLVDETHVWIEAQVAPAAAERIAKDAPARVVAHDQSIEGKVVQRSHRTQEATRTSSVRIEMPNPGDVLHPGEFVETFIATADKETVLAVPADAIVQLQGQAVVFKAVAGDRFEPVPVDAGATRGALTRIRNGLAEGDRVVVRGAYVLKARLLKAQLGEGHAD